MMVSKMHSHAKIAHSVLDLIGQTPLIELSRLTRDLEGSIYAKVEFFNPGFSKKDRVALQTLEDAEAAGILKPGQTVIELTSGNTGTGYAIACAAKGYPFIAVMSKGNSIERARMMKAFGAEVVLVDQAPGAPPGQVSGDSLALVETETQRLTQVRNAFRADQFKLAGNWRSHYLHTAREMWDQSRGKIEGFCDFIGSGGSFVGISKRLREFNPDVKCFIVEPDTCAILANKTITHKDHKIQGGGYSIAQLKFFEELDFKPDGNIQITNEEAILTARRLAKEEGIFAGFSSGANVAAALKLLRGKMRGKTLGVLLSDSSLKYLSTDLWE